MNLDYLNLRDTRIILITCLYWTQSLWNCFQ